jgi:hypothetical protein
MTTVRVTGPVHATTPSEFGNLHTAARICAHKLFPFTPPWCLRPRNRTAKAVITRIITTERAARLHLEFAEHTTSIVNSHKCAYVSWRVAWRRRRGRVFSTRCTHCEPRCPSKHPEASELSTVLNTRKPHTHSIHFGERGFTHGRNSTRIFEGRWAG